MSSPSPAPAPAPAPAAAPTQPAESGSSRFCTSHFITGEFRPSHTFPDDVAYALCLDTLVKACNDVALIHRGKVFLGKRQVFPQKDFWYGCGGRMKPGESVFDATRRLLQREVKLDLSVDELKRRLLTVGSYSFLWGKREQAPQSNGTADISVVVALELSDEEVALMAPDEFGNAQEWLSPAEIVADSSDFHPALKRSMQDYIKLCRFRELEALLLGGNGEGDSVPAVPDHPLPPHMQQPPADASTGAAPSLSDAELLAKVRSYFQYHRFISQNDTEPVQCKETL